MTEPEIRDTLRRRLDSVEERIRSACARAGRKREEVTLVAATKTVDIDVARLLPELGVLDLGESRPQELWRKAKALPGLSIRWHLIGQLQTNKIRPTTDHTTLIHSGDRLRLIQELNKEPKPVRLLIEVNASREPNKHGFAPDDISTLMAELPKYPNVDVEGFMTMAAYADNPDESRPTFREVRGLRDRFGLPQLSMGMTNDFEVGIEEGATIIRLGTILFEGLGPEG